MFFITNYVIAVLQKIDDVKSKMILTSSYTYKGRVR